jgi:peptide/nickel transport system permease protein
MAAYVLRRLLHGIVVVIVVIILVFFAGRMIGDPAELLLGLYAQESRVEALRQAMGLDQPLHIQLGQFLVNALQGNFGESFSHRAPAMPLALERLPATFFLAAVAFCSAVPLGIIIGSIAAWKPRSIFDRLSTVVSLGGVSMVDFWLALMLIIIVSVYLGLLPTSGYGEFRHVILPATVMALAPLGSIAQITRSAMLDELSKPYIKMARAKGLSERRTVFIHALKNAFIPIITVSGTILASMLNGVVVLETVFAWPGVGLLLVQSIQLRDLPMIEALVFLIAIIVVIINLLVDISYAYLNPRVRYR